MAIRNGLHQCVRDAGASTEHRLLRNAKPLCQLVCGLESDTADIACKTIWIFLHERDRVGTVGLENTDRSRSTDAVALQEDHDLADCLLIRPTGRDTFQPDQTNSFDFSQPFWCLLDDIEDRFPERLHQSLCKVRPDALDHPRTEVTLDTLNGSWRGHLQEQSAELHAVVAVPLPAPTGLHVFATMNIGGRTQHRDQITMAAHLDAKDTKTRFRAVE